MLRNPAAAAADDERTPADVTASTVRFPRPRSSAGQGSGPQRLAAAGGEGSGTPLSRG